MAEIDREPSFNAPIPGQAMTAELGSRPWQRPPLYTTVEEAISIRISKKQQENPIRPRISVHGQPRGNVVLD